MNTRIVAYLLGWVLMVEALFLCFPVVAALIFREPVTLVYLFTALGCLAVGVLLRRMKPENTSFYAREGLVTVALAWIVLGLTGAIPLLLTGEAPTFLDAVFEIVSGYTTTGATIFSNVEGLTRATRLWRSTTHWVGGMGILVFLLALLPMTGGHSIHLLRAESPGPSVNKFSSRMRDTATTLYKLYFILTALQIILLMLGKMPFYDALNVAMSTAGTGGFGLYNNSIAYYSGWYIPFITATFMILFGVNFNLYYLLLRRKWREAGRSEELHLYLLIIFFSVATITVNILPQVGSFSQALQQAYFQVASIISSTGFSNANFDLWPQYSRALLVVLMLIGACAGSTGGGIKVSRILLYFKGLKRELKSLIHPRSVEVIHFEGKRVPPETMRTATVFFTAYLAIFITSVLVLSLDQYDLVTNLSATAATLGNTGPGLGVVGPLGNFGGYSPLSKLMCIFNMLAGRLELFPMLALFLPATWRRK